MAREFGRRAHVDASVRVLERIREKAGSSNHGAARGTASRYLAWFEALSFPGAHGSHGSPPADVAPCP